MKRRNIFKTLFGGLAALFGGLAALFVAPSIAAERPKSIPGYERYNGNDTFKKVVQFDAPIVGVVVVRDRLYIATSNGLYEQELS